jgi:hypothetical protein
LKLLYSNKDWTGLDWTPVPLYTRLDLTGLDWTGLDSTPPLYLT